MEKKNIGLITALVISIIIAVGLGGYLVYEKFINTNNQEECTKCKECEICSNTDNKYRGNILINIPKIYKKI